MSVLEQAQADRAGKAAERYCLAIAALEAECGEARMVPLAVRLGATTTTAIKGVRRLQERGLATHLPYSPVRLTIKGAALAAGTRDRLHVIEQFLVGMGVDVSIARRDAEAIEPHLSAESLVALRRFTTPGRAP